MKSKILCTGFIVLGLFVALVSVVCLDRLLYYKQRVNFYESSFFNRGVHLSSVSSNVLSRPIMSVVGGSIIRFWYLPEYTPFLLYNQGGLEEKSTVTNARFSQTVFQAGARYVLINAGFCEVHTAVFTGKDLEPVMRHIMGEIANMVAKARARGVVPVLSTLHPVRPRVLLPWLGWVEYDHRFKAEENRALRNINRKISRFAADNRIFLIDFYDILADGSGALKREFSEPDGEHITPAGYQVLNAFLQEQLTKLLYRQGGDGAS